MKTSKHVSSFLRRLYVPVALCLAICVSPVLQSCTSSKASNKATTNTSTNKTTNKTTKKTTNTTKKTTTNTTKKSTTNNNNSGPMKVGSVLTGKASYYADKYEGRSTASGEPYRAAKLTCAHKTLPFGTKLKVTNTSNNKSVEVKVNDRGPYAAGRIVDLSRAAAEKIGLIQAGVANVSVTIISMP